MTLEVFTGIVATLFIGLVSVIYKNVKSEINLVRDNCDENHALNETWRQTDTDFKVDVVDRLARLETLIRENGKNAV